MTTVAQPTYLHCMTASDGIGYVSRAQCADGTIRSRHGLTRAEAELKAANSRAGREPWDEDAEAAEFERAVEDTIAVGLALRQVIEARSATSPVDYDRHPSAMLRSLIAGEADGVVIEVSAPGLTGRVDTVVSLVRDDKVVQGLRPQCFQLASTRRLGQVAAIRYMAQTRYEGFANDVLWLRWAVGEVRRLSLDPKAERLRQEALWREVLSSQLEAALRLQCAAVELTATEAFNVTFDGENALTGVIWSEFPDCWVDDKVRDFVSRGPCGRPGAWRQFFDFAYDFIEGFKARFGYDPRGAASIH